MEIYVNQDELIELQKVYLPVVFKSNDGEGMSVVMRDSGFEIQYMGTWYSAKNGVLSEIKKQRISHEEAQIKETPKQQNKKDREEELCQCPPEKRIANPPRRDMPYRNTNQCGRCHKKFR